MVNLDELDRKILGILQENGKISNVDLSKQIGLSPGPTLERVKKLEKGNLILGYHAKLNNAALGIGMTTFLQLSLNNHEEATIDAFKKSIANIEEIVECFQLTGSYDYQLKIMAKDIPSYQRVISEKLSKIKGLGQMRSMVVLAKIKDSGYIPIPTID